eukprot:UN32856
MSSERTNRFINVQTKINNRNTERKNRNHARKNNGQINEKSSPGQYVSKATKLENGDNNGDNLEDLTNIPNWDINAILARDRANDKANKKTGIMTSMVRSVKSAFGGFSFSKKSKKENKSKKKERTELQQKKLEAQARKLEADRIEKYEKDKKQLMVEVERRFQTILSLSRIIDIVFEASVPQTVVLLVSEFAVTIEDPEDVCLTTERLMRFRIQNPKDKDICAMSSRLFLRIISFDFSYGKRGSCGMHAFLHEFCQQDGWVSVVNSIFNITGSARVGRQLDFLCMCREHSNETEWGTWNYWRKNERKDIKFIKPKSKKCLIWLKLVPMWLSEPIAVGFLRKH